MPVASKPFAVSRGAFRVECRVTVRFRSPLHIGTGERLSLETDAPVLRDARGLAWIPGSSLRGVIRDWCEREAPLLGVSRAAISRLFGATPPPGKSGDDRQGRLSVGDALVVNGRTDSEIRDHVKIDPEFGAAEDRKKFDMEVANVASAVLPILYEGDSEQDEELRSLYNAIEALKAGVIPIGGKSGSGLGLFDVTKVEWFVCDRAKPQELTAFVRARLSNAATPANTTTLAPPSPASPRHRDDSEPPALSWMRLPLLLQFDGPMLTVGRAYGDFAPDSPEFNTEDCYITGINGRPILPGSSLRGVLRHHAYRIVNTLCGTTEVAGTLFGTASGDAAAIVGGRRGLVCVAEGQVESNCEVLRMEHVAIDRVTGFAVEQHLFDTAALQSPRIRTEQLVRWVHDEAVHRAALALLLLVLRDMAASLLWVGSRTTRGYGHVKGLTFEPATISIVTRGSDGLERRGALERVGPADLTTLWTRLEVGEAWKQHAESRC